MLGVVIVGFWEGTLQRAYHALRRSVQASPWSALAKMAVCTVLLVQLRPYDVVVDPIHTAYALRHADLGPLAVWRGLDANVDREVGAGRRSGMLDLERRRVGWEYCLDRLADVAAYAAVAAILSIAIIVGSGGGRWRAYRQAGFVSVTLACMVTIVRIFLISHGLDTAQFFCGVLGWPLGCLAAHLTCRNRGEADGPGAVWACGRWPIAVGICVVMVVLAYELVPFDFRASSLSLSGVIWLPFEGHFHSKPNDAVYDISGKVLRYAFLGACMMLFLRRTDWRLKPQLRWMLRTVMFVAVLVQICHLSSPSRYTDITTLILAGIGAMIGAVGFRWLIDYHAYLSIRATDDLLTTRLIDGDSYDKNQAMGPRLSRTGASPTDRVESGSPR